MVAFISRPTVGSSAMTMAGRGGRARSRHAPQLTARQLVGRGIAESPKPTAARQLAGTSQARFILAVENRRKQHVSRTVGLAGRVLWDEADALVRRRGSSLVTQQYRLRAVSRTHPAVGVRMPASMFTRVLFPLPGARKRRSIGLRPISSGWTAVKRRSPAGSAGPS